MTPKNNRLHVININNSNFNIIKKLKDYWEKLKKELTQLKQFFNNSLNLLWIRVILESIQARFFYWPKWSKGGQYE